VVFHISMPVWLVYIFLLVLMPLFWWMFFYISKSQSEFWHQDRDKVKNFTRNIRRM
jgi:hypothetical protein